MVEHLPYYPEVQGSNMPCLFNCFLNFGVHDLLRFETLKIMLSLFWTARLGLSKSG